jgi:predicted secreted protein
MNMNSRLSLCIALLSLVALLLGARFVSVSIAWQNDFSVVGDDCAHAISQNADGNYVLAGNSVAVGCTGDVAWLVMVDSSGNIEWNQTYTGLGVVYLWSVACTSDMGYIAAGYTSSGNGENYAWLLKTDSQGNLEWNQTYGNSGDSRAFSVIQTNDGGYVFAGYTGSFGQSGNNFWLVKTDSQGNMLWNQTYGGAENDEAYAVIQTNDGGFAIAGQTDSFGDGGNDAWVVKTDSSGNIQWNQTYGTPTDNGAFSLVQTSDGGYALVGYTYSNAQSQYEAWLIKTDPCGNMEWEKTCNGGGDTEALSIVQTDNGGYVLAGYTDSYGPVGSQIWVEQIGSNGKTEWSQTMGGEGDDGAFAVTKSVSNTYVVVGYQNINGGDVSNAWVAQVVPANEPSLLSPFGITLIMAASAFGISLILMLLYNKRKK